MNNELNKSVINATKWSSVTEILAKIVIPVSNMILARILTPEAFGVMATVTMVISFADMFTDSGFQKYLVQHEFESKKELNIHKNVAFTANIITSIAIWICISIFSEQIAVLVGNPGLGVAIIVAGFSLPLTAFSSIQIALHRRKFEYKTLFKVRIIEVLIPFIITIPLALLGFTYWSLITGTIVSNLVKAIILTAKSKYKYKLNCNFNILKEILSFSIWSLMETLGTWLTSYVGTFIIGATLDIYYVGLYKTTITTIDGIMAIITGATTSVMFSYLSRIQNDSVTFKRSFLNFIQKISMLIIPMGFGIFIYRDIIVSILLGKQWNEVNNFAALWGLMSSLTLVLSQYSYEVYRAKGKPKISVLSQLLNLIVVIPVLYIGSNKGFQTLIYYASLVKIWHIVVNLSLMNFIFKITPKDILKKVMPSLLGAILMSITSILLRIISSGYLWSFISIIISIFIYLIILMFIETSKKSIIDIIKILKVKNQKKLLNIVLKVGVKINYEGGEGI